MKTFQQHLREARITKALQAEIDAGVAFAKSKGIRIPSGGIDGNSKSIAAGLYSPSNDSIFISPRLKTLHGNLGYNSTNHRFHVLMHELGHMAHSDKVGQRFDTMRNAYLPQDLKEKIKKDVGRYAGTNGLEFVAEVFAALVTGKKYDEDIMRFYTNVLDGPMP
jgi:hypothetical protein